MTAVFIRLSSHIASCSEANGGFLPPNGAFFGFLSFNCQALLTNLSDPLTFTPITRTFSTPGRNNNNVSSVADLENY